MQRKLTSCVIYPLVFLIVHQCLTSALPVNRLKEGAVEENQASDVDNKNVVEEHAKANVHDGNNAVHKDDEGVKKELKDLEFHQEEQMGKPAAKKAQIDIDAIKKMEKLPIEKLKPVDHMDGVKMEQDGHMNEEYHKEMFLGNAHDEFKTEHFDEAEDRLKEIIEQADTNKDNTLDREEMENWVLTNMKKHFTEAEQENEHIFKHLDPDGDGSVLWSEYYLHFMLSRGIAADKAVEYVQDYEKGQVDTVDLMLDDKDALMSFKFKWQDADKEPEDGMLSKSEFMVFRHPEHSKASLQMMVENVLNSVDTNQDGMVSLDEFIALPPGEVEGKEFEDMDKKWQDDRRKEFREIMDINHDDKVTSEELKRYLDPTNPIQAKVEVESLLGLIDDNKDGKLSMSEILTHSEIFITSKLANFGANVHDEF